MRGQPDVALSLSPGLRAPRDSSTRCALTAGMWRRDMVFRDHHWFSRRELDSDQARRGRRPRGSHRDDGEGRGTAERGGRRGFAGPLGGGAAAGRDRTGVVHVVAAGAAGGGEPVFSGRGLSLPVGRGSSRRASGWWFARCRCPLSARSATGSGGWRTSSTARGAGSRSRTWQSPFPAGRSRSGKR